MGKIDKIEQARREGMSYALRVAKEKGIDGLEADLKMRCAVNLPVAVSKNALDQCVKQIKENTVDTVKILSAVTLSDEFGFGEKRIQRFIDRFNDKTECIAGEYCSWDDYIEVLKEEKNIHLGIRRNDKNVKNR